MVDKLSKEKLARILGFTGDVIKYNDYLTGESKEYAIGKGETVSEYKCPIDQTPLLYAEVSQAWSGHYCPNCENTFDDISEEGLITTCKNIIRTKRDELKEIREQKSLLIKIIKILEK